MYNEYMQFNGTHRANDIGRFDMSTTTDKTDSNVIRFFEAGIQPGSYYPHSPESLYDGECGLINTTEDGKDYVAARAYRSEDSSRVFLVALKYTEKRGIFEGCMKAITAEAFNAAMNDAENDNRILDERHDPRVATELLVLPGDEGEAAAMALVPGDDLDQAMDELFAALYQPTDDWRRAWSILEKDDAGDWQVVSVHDESEPTISEEQRVVELRQAPERDGKELGWVVYSIHDASGESADIDDSEALPWDLRDPEARPSEGYLETLAWLAAETVKWYVMEKADDGTWKPQDREGTDDEPVLTEGQVLVELRQNQNGDIAGMEFSTANLDDLTELRASMNDILGEDQTA